MSSKRIVRTGDQSISPAAAPDQADLILSQLASLYRERFRAMYNGNQPALKIIDKQIALLKTRLTKI